MEAQREAGQGHCERYAVPRVCLYQMPAFQQGRARCLIYPANNMRYCFAIPLFIFLFEPYIRQGRIPGLGEVRDKIAAPIASTL